MGQNPSMPGPPGTKFRVIGAGMSRTGTKTLNEALAILLDGPVHDSGIQSLGGTIRQIRHWLALMELAPKAYMFSDQKKLDWLVSDLFEGYVATMDCPAALLTPEIMKVFPDAIVIVTTRDQKSWWRSMEYLNSFMGTYHLPFVVMWLWKAQAYGEWRKRFTALLQWRYGHDYIQENTLKVHEDYQRQVVPPEKLFFYNVKDGWEPLCKILNVPVPKVPFPHNNDKAAAGRLYWEYMFWGIVTWIIALSIFYYLTKLAMIMYHQVGHCIAE
ncbi:hypothetical protein DL771_009068 [Monosporascus sp. 5C6A]|nr:hypothetical protein DL771_009068 [Monosporascus sp. 5C6A]